MRSTGGGWDGLMTLAGLRRAFAAGASPVDVAAAAHDRATAGDPAIWISMAPRDRVLSRAAEVAERPDRPLCGIPFAVKDNIDVAGLPTTAGCPEFAYTPERSATVVRRLEEAGAVLVGKTNLDQFATGLVGTRSPYGTPRNPLDARLVPGGSSSGSAVAVARGMVPFALGTDTAGSGRVPAALTGTVGLKPSLGLLSTAGVVPACRSLDCVSVFATSVADAAAVARLAAGPDPADPFARWPPPGGGQPDAAGRPLRVGVPAPAAREFFGNAAYERAYAAALEQLAELGHAVHEVDYEPFREAAALLYSGPWVAERLVAVTPLVDERPDALLPVTREIIEQGRAYSAADCFRAIYRLAELRRRTAESWRRVDLLALPTIGTSYTLEEVAADPIATNTNLGYYTNFVNLLDLCALAVPAGRADGLLFGVTLLAPAFQDGLLVPVAERLHERYGGPAPAAATPAAGDGAGATLDLAVFGLHLTGQPLNSQLTGLGATLVRSARTSDAYRLYRIAGSPAPGAAGTAAALDRPGAVRGEPGSGRPIELEIWRLPAAAVGRLLTAIEPPLGLGTVELEDGGTVRGFICEQWIAAAAEEITELGGWRAYLAGR